MEKYWREKFEAECLEMDDEDHTDLSAMFDKAGSNVPEHMASLHVGTTATTLAMQK